MQSHISVRIDPETKRKLERLAGYFGVNLSDLLRKYILPLTRAELELKALKTIKNMEKMVLKAIITSDEFQGLLRELKKFMREEEFCSGCDCQYTVSFNLVPNSFLTLIEKDVLWPAFVERIVEGLCTYYETERVETLMDLAKWLEELEYSLGVALSDKIREVKEAVRELTS